MVIRSVALLICIFMAVTTASDYREPVSIIGYDPQVTLNGPRTENSEWSLVESVQKIAELPGSGARLVMDRAAVVASRPAVAAMLERQVVGAPQDVRDPILQQLRDLLQNARVANMAVPAPSDALTYAEPNLEAVCEQQVAEQLSAETAVAAAVWAMKHSCDSQRETTVSFIKDNMGHVLGTQGWAHAVRTQPEEVVQLSRLLAEQLAATSTPATTQSTTTTASQPDGDYSGHDQTSDDAPTHVVTCPTTPVDDDRVSFFRTLPEERKGEMLIEAAKEGDVEKLRALLAAGTSPDTRDMDTRTVLQWAGWRGQAEAASCLLDAGAGVGTIDFEGYQPLHMAAIGGNPDVVRLLAAWGADPNAKDKWGWTPLHLTVREKKPEAALALLEVGADREFRNYNGLTPLEMASGGRYLDKEMADLLALAK